MWRTLQRISLVQLPAFKISTFLSIICFAVIEFICIGSCFAQSGASYTALRRSDTITVDGHLNDASWQNAPSTAAFTVWNGSAAPTNLQTSAKLVWDDLYLFIGFTARDPDVYATYSGRDVKCWEQDTFEVFVTVPGTTGYVEVDGSPTGAIWDGFFTNVFKGLGGSYNLANLQVAGQVNGTLNNSTDQDIGFTGELRIPFSDIYQGTPGGHPIDGTQLRLNLNRINWNTPATQGGPGATGSDTYYAWSPVTGASVSFHRPDKFGTVTFSTNVVAAPIWMFTGTMLSDTNLTLTGAGQPGATYWVLVSTDAVLEAANWTRIATNAADPVTGQFSFTSPIAPDSPQRFFRLLSP